MSCTTCGFIGDDVIVHSCLEDLTGWAQIPLLFIPTVVFFTGSYGVSFWGTSEVNFRLIAHSVWDCARCVSHVPIICSITCVMAGFIPFSASPSKKKKSMLINLCEK